VFADNNRGAIFDLDGRNFVVPISTGLSASSIAMNSNENKDPGFLKRPVTGQAIRINGSFSAWF